MKKRVSFYSSGYKLAGTLFIPDNIAQGQKRSGIVLSGGFASSRDHSLLSLSQYLCEKGYVLLSIDFRGFGESEGVRGRLFPMEEIEDIKSAITFLQQQTHVNGANIGLIGASFGGALATYVAAVDKRVSCVASLAGVGSCLKWLRSQRRNWEWAAFLEELAEDRVKRVLTGTSRMVDRNCILIPEPTAEAFLKDMKATDPNFCGELSLESAQAILDFDPEEVIHKIAPRPILFIIGEKDTTTPSEFIGDLYDKAGEPKRFVSIPGAAHFAIFHPPSFETVATECLNWFEKYLPL